MRKEWKKILKIKNLLQQSHDVQDLALPVNFQSVLQHNFMKPCGLVKTY